MLKVATVFSGIGAVEQALQRLNLPHRIIFACDNGDVSPFAKIKVKDGEEHKFFTDLKFEIHELVKERPTDLALVSLVNHINSLEHYFENKDSDDIRSQKKIKSRLEMLCEELKFAKFRVEWEKKEDFLEKKHEVDKLYSRVISRNNVRKSYLENYKLDEKNFHWNVSFLEGKQYEGQVDLFVGGSPCQSFSLVGKQMGLDDTRGSLFYEYARLVKEIQPKCFIYENVKSIISNKSGETWKVITKIFSEIGYDWQFAVLNAKDFGIPQNRERVFVVGFRRDLGVLNKFEFPQKQKLKYCVQDFLQDSVPQKYFLPEKGVKFVTNPQNLSKRFTQINGDVLLCQKKNQQFNWHGDFIRVEDVNGDKNLDKYYLSDNVKKYVLSSGTKSFYAKPQIDLNVARPLLKSMHKMHRAGVDNYYSKNGKIRKLTPRECLRLMGFSDAFKIVVSDTAIYQQAGNAIVVDVLIALINQIKKSVKL